MTTPNGALVKYGVPLAEAGYEVIPVARGQKRPTEDEWQKMSTGPAQVRKWASNGKADHNVGIRTANTPAIDIDIFDNAEMAQELNDWCQENIGPAPARIGRAPKVLLVYSTDTPFKKCTLVFRRPEDDKKCANRIEVLGDGQQFLAYGPHPDTQKPYFWPDTSLVDLETWELTTLTLADVERLFDAATKIAKNYGWKVQTRSIGRNSTSAFVSDEDDLQDIGDMALDTDFTDEELTQALELLDPDEGYDAWLRVGQALHHHFHGSGEGRDMWDDWSQRSFTYSGNEIEEKWTSFNELRSGGTITARSIIHLAKEAKQQVAKQSYEDIIEQIDLIEDVLLITNGTFIRQIAKKLDDKSLIDPIADKLKQQAKKLGTNVRVDSMRKALKAALRKSTKRQLPEWCDHFVYVQDDDSFYNMRTHRSISERGFNAEFNRMIQGGDDETPSASRFVLDTLEMPVHAAYIYRPGFDNIVYENGESFVNTYSSSGIPEEPIPGFETEGEQAAVELVENHFKMMFPDDREREILISYLAFIVQNPTRRVRWCPLIHGGEGSGKTFIYRMMSNVLGPTNTMPVGAEQLKEQFTGWAADNRLVVFEEIRLAGHNRFEILDKLKPFMTNDYIDVRKMRTDLYKAKNVACYIMFTNHRDALPLSDGDRRYFVLSTSLLTRSQIAAFNHANPLHFTKLFKAIDDHPGAILAWLSSYLLHDEFKPNGNPPDTDAKNLMRDVSHDEEFDGLDEIIRSAPRWDVSEDLLNLSSLVEVCDGTNLDGDEAVALPPANRMSPVMKQLGFEFIGKARIGEGANGKRAVQKRYWSRNPDMLGGLTIQNFVEQRYQTSIDDDNLGL